MTERLEALEQSVDALRNRVTSQSTFIMNELLPVLDKMREDMDALWISNDRFTELERAVADVRIALFHEQEYRQADRRLRPRRKYTRIK